MHRHPIALGAVLTSLLVSSLGLVSARAQGVVVTLEVTGTIGDVSGSYLGALVTGQTINATFSYNTDEGQAGPGSQSTPSTEPGHEFSSFYEFSSPPYGAHITIPSIPATFDSTTAALVVNDDLPLLGADLNNYVGDGTYDWIEILGSTTTDGPTGNPADGEEWTLALFTDTSWITDGSLIPDDLPGSYTPVMLGIEFDEFENEAGVAWVNISSINVVPEPSPALLLGAGLLLLSLPRRR